MPASTVDELNAASPANYYAKITPRRLVQKVMKKLYRQQYRGYCCCSLQGAAQKEYKSYQPLEPRQGEPSLPNKP